jgi:UDP-glucose 4-epimerase
MTRIGNVDLSGYDGASVLVTGGLGFIGSGLARVLAQAGARVTVVDNLLEATPVIDTAFDGVREPVSVYIEDVCDPQVMRERVVGQDYVFHLAARTSHPDSMRDPLGDLDINARGTLTLLEAARASNPAVRTVFTSTRQVYGRPVVTPVNESYPARPVDANGVSKRAAEMYCELYACQYGMDIVVLRLTNIYGPHMRLDDRHCFLGLWIERVATRRPFEVWAGAQRRDPLYVDDAIAACCAAGHAGSLSGRPSNVGGPESPTLMALAETLVAINQGGLFHVRAFPEARAAIDIGDWVIDDRAFRAATGWAPTVSLRDGLSRTLAYAQARHAAVPELRHGA